MNKKQSSLKPILYGLSFILFFWIVFFIIITKVVPNYTNLENLNELKFLFPFIVILAAISFVGGIITSKFSKNNKLINLVLLGIITASLIFIYRLSVENVNYYRTSKQFFEWKKRDLYWVIETHQNNHKAALKKIYLNYPKTLLSQLILTTSGGFSLIFLQNLVKTFRTKRPYKYTSL